MFGFLGFTAHAKLGDSGCVRVSGLFVLFSFSTCIFLFALFILGLHVKQKVTLFMFGDEMAFLPVFFFVGFLKYNF